MDTTKIELGLINKIKNKIQENVIAKVPFNTFIKLWQPQNERELTSKLINFKINNNLDYVVIVNPRTGPQFVQFWSTELKQLPAKEDVNNALHSKGKEEKAKQDN